MRIDLAGRVVNTVLVEGQTVAEVARAHGVSRSLPMSCWPATGITARRRWGPCGKSGADVAVRLVRNRCKGRQRSMNPQYRSGPGETVPQLGT